MVSRYLVRGICVKICPAGPGTGGPDGFVTGHTQVQHLAKIILRPGFFHHTFADSDGKQNEKNENKTKKVKTEKVKNWKMLETLEMLIRLFFFF